jgi:hypothetical protein
MKKTYTSIWTSFLFFSFVIYTLSFAQITFAADVIRKTNDVKTESAPTTPLTGTSEKTVSEAPVPNKIFTNEDEAMEDFLARNGISISKNAKRQEIENIVLNVVQLPNLCSLNQFVSSETLQKISLGVMTLEEQEFWEQEKAGLQSNLVSSCDTRVKGNQSGCRLGIASCEQKEALNVIMTYINTQSELQKTRLKKTDEEGGWKQTGTTKINEISKNFGYNDVFKSSKCAVSPSQQATKNKPEGAACLNELKNLQTLVKPSDLKTDGIFGDNTISAVNKALNKIQLYNPDEGEMTRMPIFCGENNILAGCVDDQDVDAGGGVHKGYKTKNFTLDSFLTTYLPRISSYLVFLLSGFTVIMFILGGYKIILSFGDAQKMKQGIYMMVMAGGGLLLATFSYTIIKIVLNINVF